MTAGLLDAMEAAAGTPPSDLDTISAHESAVRTYCRGTPVVFTRGRGSEIFDEHGHRYIDFLCAAGSLNYGHNDPQIKQALLAYLQRDGILQTLDFATAAKAAFLREFQATILGPRGLDYRVQFTGPTGTNSVEAAIKIARKVTRRQNVVAFTNAYHGVSLGALALTGNRGKRSGAGVGLDQVTRLPFDGYPTIGDRAAAFARQLLTDPSGGCDLPAAIILETVQGEGGLNCASGEWLAKIAALARELGALLIVDDIQAGCGRTGSFFSFEPFGLVPDVVCLSKSISGCGLPMALTLIAPQHDQWQPGEHNGTFRGNNLAFVGATAALGYWRDPAFAAQIASLGTLVHARLEAIVDGLRPGRAGVAGRGLFKGLRFARAEDAETLRLAALDLGVLTETCGPHDETLKVMPALNIPLALAEEGLGLLARAAARL